MAVAAEILRSAYHMLSRDEAYKEPGESTPNPKQKERAAKRLVGRLRKLGYEVELPEAA